MGIYVAVKYDDKSCKNIEEFIKNNNIPNSVPTDKLHSTLIYSRQYDDVEVAGNNFKVPVEIFKLELWKTQDGNSALVAKLFAPELIKRHLEHMSNYNLTYDYPEYKPHITISYNVPDDFDIKSLDIASIERLYTSEEYKEDLEEDWATKNGT